jgi:hypothetical protein
MSEFEQVSQAPQPTTTEPAQEVQPSDPATGAPDTPETQVAETDEQKNARELAERQKRSERAQAGIKKRIDELTADKYAERARADRAEAERKQLWDALQGRQQQPNPDAEPTRDQYQDYETFQRAVARHEARQEARAVAQQEREAIQRQIAEAQKAFAMAQMRQTFSSRLDAYAKANPEFSEAMEAADNIDIPEEAGAILHELEEAPEVMLAMAKNPSLAKSLHGKSYAQQAVLIGQMVASLKMSPRVSTAPPPGTPVGSRGGPTNKDPSQMNYDEFVQFRRKQIAARR